MKFSASHKPWFQNEHINKYRACYRLVLSHPVLNTLHFIQFLYRFTFIFFLSEGGDDCNANSKLLSAGWIILTIHKFAIYRVRKSNFWHSFQDDNHSQSLFLLFALQYLQYALLKFLQVMRYECYLQRDWENRKHDVVSLVFQTCDFIAGGAFMSVDLYMPSRKVSA